MSASFESRDMMSTTSPSSPLSLIPPQRAANAAKWLIRRLDCTVEPPHAGGAGDMGLFTIALAGSLRRGTHGVGDADLLAEMPPCEGRGSEGDPLYEAIAKAFGDPKAAEKAPLFGPATAQTQTPAGVSIHVESGLAVGFGRCRLLFELPGSPEQLSGWAEPYTLKVEIHRYTPGPNGNRGWKEMIITGPGANSDREIGWGEMMLTRWKRRNPGGRSHQCWPVYADGSREPVPTEARAFELVGLRWIDPKHRTVVLAKQLADSGARA